MARILVASMPFAGHIGPVTAVAAELARRGHRIVGYTGAKYGDRFASVGARWLPFTRARDFDDTRLADTFPQVGDGKGLRGARANSEYVLFGTSAGQAEDMVAEGRREPFDLLVSDELAFGSPLAAEILGIPWATVTVTPLGLISRYLPPPGVRLLPPTGRLGRVRDAALRGVLRLLYRRMVNPLVDRSRAALGLGPARTDALESLYSPHLILTQGVVGLDYPRADLPSQVHYVGRLARAAAPAAPDPVLPDWWPDLAAARAAGRPVVYATQGTLDLDFDDLLRPAVAGLAGQDVLLVCTTGGRPPAALGPLPDNVRAAPYLPYDRFLPLVDVMVTNGGWGGVLAAVHSGIPLVVAGGSLDKPEVARRVAWSGAGLDLRTGHPAPHRVRRAVTRVLGEPAMRERARELGAAMTAAGGAERAADLVERLLPR